MRAEEREQHGAIDERAERGQCRERRRIAPSRQIGEKGGERASREREREGGVRFTLSGGGWGRKIILSALIFLMFLALFCQTAHEFLSF